MARSATEDPTIEAQAQLDATTGDGGLGVLVALGGLVAAVTKVGAGALAGARLAGWFWVGLQRRESSAGNGVGQNSGRRPNRRSVFRMVPVLIAVFMAVLMSGCGQSVNTDGGFVSGDGSITRFSIEERKLAPEIAGMTLDGDEFSSKSLDRQVIVYNVWGSWCAPCVKEAPALVAAAKRTAREARFVGLNTRDLDPAPARAFVRAFDVPYPNIYDPDGELMLKFDGLVPATAIPSTLIIDTQGRIAVRILGETTEATLVGLITDVAAGR